MADCKPAPTAAVPGTTCKRDADQNGSSRYQELIGSLMYLAVTSRPDIAHTISVLSQYNMNNFEEDWKATKRLLRYLKGAMDLCLVYSKDGMKLDRFAHADWGNGQGAENHIVILSSSLEEAQYRGRAESNDL
ncbi:hypothetical protein Trydic_g7768 [Trypoxylus dichotomus]